MTEDLQPAVPPVLAAMAALDEAVAAHRFVAERFQGAAEEVERLDEQLRRCDPEDEERLLPLAQALGFAVSLAQSLARREERARLALGQAQRALAGVRREELRLHAAELRAELEQDAASIVEALQGWEGEVRARLDRHKALAAEVAMVERVSAEGPLLQAPPATPWTAAAAASGAELWSAVAGGLREVAGAALPAAPALPPHAPPPPEPLPQAAGVARLPAARVLLPLPPEPARPAPPREPEEELVAGLGLRGAANGWRG